MLRIELMADNWEPPFQLGILTLNSWSLGPKFPYWLQNQTNLSVLYLGSTETSDNIPSWFWSTFSGLKYLNISDNNLSSVPLNDFLCSKMDMEQKQVIYMNMGNTNLSGVLPDCWTAWEFLNILNFQNNNLTGEILKSLANLSSLESLNLNLKSLQIVDLSNNKFIGGIPTSIAGEATGEGEWVWQHSWFTYILDLSSNDLHGGIPSEITQLVELRFLNFSGNQLTGRIPEKIGDMKLLELLDLSRNQLDGMVPLSMSRLSFLNSLNLLYNNLTGRIPSSTQLQSFQESSFVGN
ncbi:hypothetical protein R6Q59_014930 [Mikania micrantha]